MILPDHAIKKCIDIHKLLYVTSHPLQIGPACIDFHLSPHFHYTDGIVKSVDEASIPHAHEAIILNPGDFILGATEEYIGIPNDIMAICE